MAGLLNVVSARMKSAALSTLSPFRVCGSVKHFDRRNSFANPTFTGTVLTDALTSNWGMFHHLTLPKSEECFAK